MTTKTKTNTIEKYDGQKLIEEFGTKSSVIRYLNSEGLTRSQIAKILDIRYQHVRNVLVTPLKRKDS